MCILYAGQILVWLYILLSLKIDSLNQVDFCHWSYDVYTVQVDLELRVVHFVWLNHLLKYVYYPLQVAVLVPRQSQQKQPSNTGTVSARFIRASGTNTLTPSRKRTVTVCSVVGTLYTDFKNGTVLFTVELRTTDRLSPSLHRLSSATSVKEPL